MHRPCILQLVSIILSNRFNRSISHAHPSIEAWGAMTSSVFCLRGRRVDWSAGVPYLKPVELQFVLICLFALICCGIINSSVGHIPANCSCLLPLSGGACCSEVHIPGQCIVGFLFFFYDKTAMIMGVELSAGCLQNPRTGAEEVFQDESSAEWR